MDAQTVRPIFSRLSVLNRGRTDRASLHICPNFVVLQHLRISFAVTGHYRVQQQTRCIASLHPRNDTQSFPQKQITNICNLPEKYNSKFRPAPPQKGDPSPTLSPAKCFLVKTVISATHQHYSRTPHKQPYFHPDGLFRVISDEKTVKIDAFNT